MCSTLGLSRSGYYDWLNRKPSKRQQEDEELLEKISEIHEQSRETYGSLKIQKALEQQEKRVGRNRILRLMRVGQLEAKRMRIIRPRTTTKSERPAAPNLLNQRFEATAINQIWLSDITYIPVREEGWLYLAAVMDLFSRRIVGWSMDSHMPDSLTISALQMALQHRQPPKGHLMHHSDRGSQYTSDDYTHLLAQHQIDVSNSRKGNCFDNAPMESFFSNLKLELIYHHDFAREQARRAIFEYIEVFYNRIRIHSATDYLAPAIFEQRFHDQTSLVPETLRV